MMNESIAQHWQQLDNGKIRCDVCPRECTLDDDQRGLCYVRVRKGDEMSLSTYGRSSGFCIDPIEKKPLNHFLPGTPILSFGTAGCNLSCRFCQNWDISKSRTDDRLNVSASPTAIAQSAADAGCRSVAMTYNDPVIFLEYAIDTAIACHDRGIQAVAVTAAYIKANARKDFFEPLDAANIDLKAFSETFYRQQAAGSLKPVLETLVWIREHLPLWFELTTLIIPGLNDDPKEIREMSRWIRTNLGAHTPIHFSAFHPDYKLTDIAPTSAELLQRCRHIALEEELQFVYTGNIHDATGDTTFCPSCNATLIERDWYELKQWNLVDGACSHCQTSIPGLFEPQPGTWGRRRKKISLGH